MALTCRPRKIIERADLVVKCHVSYVWSRTKRGDGELVQLGMTRNYMGYILHAYDSIMLMN